ncbi:MAG: glycosyltransferase [Bacteroidales bacterium]|nr:glycosyltransferase [Bacteroidales bacterium]
MQIRRELGIDSLYRDFYAHIDVLRSVQGSELKVITAPDLGSWPSNKLIIRGFYDNEDNARSVGIFNFPFLKQFWIVLSLFFAAASAIRKSGESTVVVIPCLVYHHVAAGTLLKLRFGSRVSLLQIVPDLFFPQGGLEKLVNRRAEKLARRSEGFVFYTEAMASALKIDADSRYVVIEGFSRVQRRPVSVPQVFTICYTGSLNLCYGLVRLLDAMQYLPYDGIELHLYGAGDAEGIIRERCGQDQRIKFFGKVGKDEAEAAVSSASVLVNPRNDTDGEYVAYSFPSKDIEYLASGVPAVLCRLPGMPEEYYDYFVDATPGSPEDLAKAIMKVMEMSAEQRSELTAAAFDFVSQRMDSRSHAEKILSLISA